MVTSHPCQRAIQRLEWTGIVRLARCWVRAETLERGAASRAFLKSQLSSTVLFQLAGKRRDSRPRTRE